MLVRREPSVPPVYRHARGSCIFVVSLIDNDCWVSARRTNNGVTLLA